MFFVFIEIYEKMWISVSAINEHESYHGIKNREVYIEKYTISLLKYARTFPFLYYFNVAVH